MDKQELENRVLNPGINNNITINGKTYIRESRALYLIGHLDEPEKPEIPKFVADWIRGLRILDVTDLDIIGLYFSKEIEKKCEQWITDNFNDFIKALVNGYTEKEPVWVVLKDAQYFHAFTGEYDESEGFEYVLAMYEGHAHTFADKQKAEAVATLVDGTFKEWSE
ncbi:DUF1642 domain-containing protein [Tetragenococcus halophilus]|uniref:DUF1642 domain-containing protein n=1 Tax=Tetragenococcus halophilus TaxID=51669 RepID=UPI00209B4227|nr:DUF1642 domain-containing protein [Tetragenococcus halophilus]MCO8286663.1 DUF1642 domain-containing protein [Tetragenococcus halophilus]